MAKKVQKKPSKKTQTKPAAKAKKAAAPAKKAKAAVKKAAKPAKKIRAPKEKTAPTPEKAKKSFSVAEFANMTYLTEKGVTQWLRQGLLKGQQNAQGEWQIEASNLEIPNVKRLVR
jgi:hypothetical protein